MTDSIHSEGMPRPRFLWDTLQATLYELAPEGRFALAYSGGLDSRFIAHAAQRAGLTPLLLHVRGPHIPPMETMFARRWAAWRGLTLRELSVDPLSLPSVATGNRERCYQCKSLLFARIRDEAEGLLLCDGTNASDGQGYRPGLKALRELAVASPLALAGLAKTDIRKLAELSGLEHPDQRARPCLLTRLNYGLRPTPERLKTLVAAERAVFELLRGIYADHWPDFRLRLTAEQRWELHIRPLPTSTAVGNKTTELHARLVQAVREATGIQVACVVQMESLSGYFDHPPRL